MSHIDWTTELRKIEREFSGLPPEPSPAQTKAKRAAEQRAQERKDTQSAFIGALLRMIFVAALAVGLVFWPYARTCGAGLFSYMGAEALVLVGGVWTSTITWRGRLPRLHMRSLALVLWSLVALGADAAPRVGYARTNTGHPLPWVCR